MFIQKWDMASSVVYLWVSQKTSVNLLLWVTLFSLYAAYISGFWFKKMKLYVSFVVHLALPGI